MVSVGEIIQRIFRTSINSIITTDNSVDAIIDGRGWVANYSFNLASGSTAYLAFKTFDKKIHARGRSVNVVDLGNKVINVSVETLVNATVNTLGSDISSNIINANLNLSNIIELEMYDETTTITSEGSKIPFSGTIAGDKKQTGTAFISDEYILKTNDVLVLKFVNNGSDSVRIEYNSNGYQVG